MVMILKDGEPVSPQELVADLNLLLEEIQELKEVIVDIAKSKPLTIIGDDEDSKERPWDVNENEAWDIERN